MQRPCEALISTRCANLNGLKNLTIENFDWLMRRNKDANRLIFESANTLHFTDRTNVIIGGRQIRREINTDHAASVRNTIRSIAPILKNTSIRPGTCRQGLIRSIPNATHNLRGNDSGAQNGCRIFYRSQFLIIYNPRPPIIEQ